MNLGKKVARLLDVLQHEREQTRAILDTLATTTPVKQCDECDRLLAAFVFGLVRTTLSVVPGKMPGATDTTSVLEEREQAADGLMGDLDFLAPDGVLEEALGERQRAREAYLQHRRDRHICGAALL